MGIATESGAQQPQFYKKVTALNPDGHGQWKIRAQLDHHFALETNAVLLTAVEFSIAACEYPIVFIENGDSVLPVAVLGLKSGQNLFITDKGAWDARYIPAYVRRYPFILSGAPTGNNDGGTQYTVCIDEDYPGFNQETGEALFTGSGGHSKYLEGVITFLKDFQSQGLATERFCKNIKKLDILEPMQAKFTVPKQDDVTMAGFMVVSPEKLKAKKPLELAELVKSDEMGLIYHHLASMRNFAALTAKFTGKPPEK